MLDEDTAAFLETGCAITVATVSADGDPHASRGWGANVLSRDDEALEVLVDVEDVQTLANVADNDRVAITVAHVPTLHSLQLKGRVTSTRTGAQAERDRARGYCDEFYRDIHETEGTSYQLLERMTPADYVVLHIELDERYDQTPGPTAGAKAER